MKFWKSIPFYPLLLGFYPALALLATNSDQVRAPIAARTLILSLIAAGILLLLARAVLRSWPRAALLAAWLLLFFSVYGQVYQFLELHPLGGFTLGRHTYLLPVWLALMVLGAWVILKKVPRPETPIGVLNLLTLGLVIVAAVQIISLQVRADARFQNSPPAALLGEAYHLPAGQMPPDIYYIILDGYTRDDELLDSFGYDNSAFLEELQAMGFYVASCAQSNYAQTELSLSSSLNSNYLEALGDSFTPNSQDRSELWPLLKNSNTRQILEGLGYRTIAFETGYYWIDWNDADYYYVSDQINEMNALLGQGGMNAFEILYLRSTLFLAVLDLGQKVPSLNVALTAQADYPYRASRERVLFTLEKLESHVPLITSPKFVYAHLIIPHDPFIFAPEGSWLPLEANDPQGYCNQVQCINQRILPILQGIIENSSSPPIIILQGDHGSGISSPAGRMRILNAYYLPGAGKALLYDSISPVNTFRVVLNAYFGGELELLPDISYYSTYDDPYIFTEMPEARPGCQGR